MILLAISAVLLLAAISLCVIATRHLRRTLLLLAEIRRLQEDVGATLELGRDASARLEEWTA